MVTAESAVRVVLAAVAVGLAACGGGGGDEPAASPSTVAQETVTTAAPGSTTATTLAATTTTSRGATSTSTSTTRPVERLTADSRLRLDGIGPINVGMTPAEASAAAGVPIRVDPNDPFGPECQYASAAAGPAALRFMVIDGKIARVDVGNPGSSSIRTVSGVGMGSTEDQVKATYPGRIRVEGHPYVPSGRYLIYTPADASLQHLSLIFETDGRVVTSFRSGLKGAVAQIEGCA